MKTYKIPIVWQAIKEYEVKAENLQEAAEKALNQFLGKPSSDGSYIEDSFEIDGIIEDNYPGEEFDYSKILVS